MSSLKESVLQFLRGDYNSIRYRYLHLPREYATYYFRYRLRGRSWVDFYGERLDKSQASRPGDINFSPAYLESGEKFLAFMIKHGLQPHHRFLDYGCGVMRTGVQVVQHLEPNRYVGVDIAQERLTKAGLLAAKIGIDPGRYETVLLHDCELKELDGRTFDFVWAWSVINHMPEADIRIMMRSVRPLVAPDGKFLFCFNRSERPYRMRLKDWWHPVSLMREICEGAGFRFELLEDMPLPQPPETVMAQLTVPS
jgi:2-polyprenyl-3-methyl-5-hydroxy-6-metoxy-1,4-benzoquinol methylase